MTSRFSSSMYKVDDTLQVLRAGHCQIMRNSHSPCDHWPTCLLVNSLKEIIFTLESDAVVPRSPEPWNMVVSVWGWLRDYSWARTKVLSPQGHHRIQHITYGDCYRSSLGWSCLTCTETTFVRRHHRIQQSHMDAAIRPWLVMFSAQGLDITLSTNVKIPFRSTPAWVDPYSINSIYISLIVHS